MNSKRASDCERDCVARSDQAWSPHGAADDVTGRLFDASESASFTARLHERALLEIPALATLN